MVKELSEEENFLLKKALNKLCVHDYTKRALYEKLKKETFRAAKVVPASAKTVVVWLVLNGYLKEGNYFEQLYPRLKARGYGPRWIANDLKKRQFAQKYIDRVMCDEASALERACEMAKKRVLAQHYNFSDYREKQKLFSYLLRIGYDAEDAKSAVERIIMEFAEEQ